MTAIMIPWWMSAARKGATIIELPAWRLDPIPDIASTAFCAEYGDRVLAAAGHACAGTGS